MPKQIGLPFPRRKKPREMGRPLTPVQREHLYDVVRRLQARREKEVLQPRAA